MTATLLDIQRRMAVAVMEPLTQMDAMRKRRRDGVVMACEAPEFIKPSAALTAVERLEIYNRQYWFRLYDSFQEDFPGLKAVLGRTRFERLMRAYIADCPSTSYTLRDLGARLPAWLIENEAFTGPDRILAQDVVRLEWAHIEAYDGASYPAPSPEFLASITEQSHLALQPYVQLLALSYPADEFMIRLRRDAGSSDISSNNATSKRKQHPAHHALPVASESVWLAVHRQDFTVYYKRLCREEYQILVTLQSGEPLGEVFAAGFVDSPIAEEARPGFLQECFQQWTTLGWLREPSTPNRMRHTGESQ